MTNKIWQEKKFRKMETKADVYRHELCDLPERGRERKLHDKHPNRAIEEYMDVVD